MKLKKILLIALSLMGILVLALLIGKINLSIQFHSEVKKLFSQSKNISDRTFRYEQLLGLPQPVQRYFRHVLKESQPYISQVRLKHDGQFKTALDKDWIPINGEQYFTVEKPGYMWKGSTALFTARDMYIEDQGRLLVSLFGLFNVVDGEGEKFDEGELQRWLAEGVWFPTNLLPSERVKWLEMDSTRAKLQFTYKNLALSYVVTFNEKEEIAQMETQRYMGEGRRETWLGKFEEYQEQNGILVPMKVEAYWKLQKRLLPYAQFQVKVIEYNTPFLF